MSPELRAGNASLRADGDETLGGGAGGRGRGRSVPARDADGGRPCASCCSGATAGRSRRTTAACATACSRPASAALARIGGRQGRRRLRPPPAAVRQRAVDWAVFRLARLPERRERLLARGGDAFALAEALRATRPRPARSSCSSPELLAIADDCGADEQARRRGLVERARARRAPSSRQLDDAAWLALCALYRRARCAWRAGSRASGLPAHESPWAYDAGRRLALVTPAAREALAPERPAPTASPELVAAVLGAVRP